MTLDHKVLNLIPEPTSTIQFKVALVEPIFTLLTGKERFSLTECPAKFPFVADLALLFGLLGTVETKQSCNIKKCLPTLLPRRLRQSQFFT